MKNTCSRNNYERVIDLTKQYIPIQVQLFPPTVIFM